MVRPNTRAFVGSNPTGESITSGLLVGTCEQAGSLNAGTCITILPEVPYLEQQVAIEGHRTVNASGGRSLAAICKSKLFGFRDPRIAKSPSRSNVFGPV
jgi:hypothetical protein